MPVLPDQQHLARVVQGDDGHGAGVLHHVPFGQVIVGHADLVGPYRDQAAAGCSAEAATGQCSGVSAMFTRRGSCAGRGAARPWCRPALERSRAAAIRPGEQRMRPGRAGQELRVRLGRDEERVAGQLGELHQVAVRRQAGEDQPGLLEGRTVGVVDLVPVPVPLLDQGAAVQLLAPGCPACSTAGYRPRRMVPPMSRSPATTSSWSAMVAITGYGVSGSNSALSASASPARSRATSMAMHCRPRHRPRIGMPCSRAYRIAPIFPSMPRTPNPPGIRTPSTPVELGGRALGVLAVVAGHPADVHLRVVGEAAGLAAPRPATGRRRAGRRTCRPARW